MSDDIRLINEYCMYKAYRFYGEDILLYLRTLAPIDTGELREKLWIDFYIEDGECIFSAGSDVSYYKHAMDYQRKYGALFDKIPRDSVADTWNYWLPHIVAKAQRIKADIMKDIALATANKVREYVREVLK